MRQLLRRIDDASARVERVVVLGCLAIMAGVVFLDVVHRVASSSDGIILRILTAFAGGSPSPATDEFFRRFAVPAIVIVLTFVFYYGAFRTVSSEKISPARAALSGLACTVGTGGALALLLWVFPNGLVWSQPLALSLLLWVSLGGATLVTRLRGHIALEVVDKIWSKKLMPYARLVSGLIAGLFCLAVMVLSIHYVEDFVQQWREGVGYLAGMPMPKWVAFLAMPVGFLLMGLRFLGYAIADFGRRHLVAAGEVPS